MMKKMLLAILINISIAHAKKMSLGKQIGLFILTIVLCNTAHALTFTVTTDAPSGPGSFIEALSFVNSNPSTEGAPHRILFAIPGTGTQSINYREVPIIDNPVIIDGWSQSSTNHVATDCQSQGNTRLIPAIKISTIAGSTSANALNFVSDGNSICGLIFKSNTLAGAPLLSFGNPAGTITRKYSDRNRVMGNWFAIDETGNSSVSVVNFYVYGSNNQIGGTTDSESNWFNSLNRYTVLVKGKNNLIINNRFNINPISDQEYAGINGIYVGTPGAVSNVPSSTGNRIQSNQFSKLLTGSGVVITGTSSTGNIVIENTISGTQSIGVDLGDDVNANGLTANDSGDSDVGPNNLQNYPVLNSIAIQGTALKILGELNSSANTAFRIDFFANSNQHATSRGPAQRFITSRNVTTSSNGTADFSTLATAIDIPISALPPRFQLDQQHGYSLRCRLQYFD